MCLLGYPMYPPYSLWDVQLAKTGINGCNLLNIVYIFQSLSAFQRTSKISTDMSHSAITLSPLLTTEVPYANSLDLDETPSNSASHPDPNYLTLIQYFHHFDQH